MNIYNEIEPYAASWVRNLVKTNQIVDGEVSGDSIKDLQAADVANAVQFHAFAGIGGWSYALRLAGWPDDQPVWTGSCPCQPFSGAGRRGGFDDDRHLWPAWFNLIKECRPPVIFGEQVASPDGLAWLDVVSADLEDAGYSFGAADLCAAGVGAPHIRQRLYFVAYNNDERCTFVRASRIHDQRQRRNYTIGRGAFGELGNASRERGGRDARTVSRTQGEGESERVAVGNLIDESELTSANQLADAKCNERRQVSQVADRGGSGSGTEGLEQRSLYGSAVNGFWENAEWIPCRDKEGTKYRPIEPGTFPLAHGTTARVGRLRAYGNAIVPQVAATFIRACIEARINV